MNNLPFQVLNLLKSNSVDDDDGNDGIHFHTKVDAIIMSCTRQRLAQLYLSDAMVYDRITEEDRAKAQSIRKHYEQLLICEKLKGKELTSFRKELELLLSVHNLRYNESWKGIIYKLPYFYDYDIELQHLKENVFVNKPEHSPHQSERCETLTPISKTFRNYKSGQHYVYWFEIGNTKTAAKIEIEKNNTMLTFWDNIFNQKIPMQIEGRYKLSSDQELISYKVENWKIKNLEIKT